MNKLKPTFAQRIAEKLRKLLTKKKDIDAWNRGVREVRKRKKATSGVRGALTWTQLRAGNLPTVYAKY